MVQARRNLRRYQLHMRSIGGSVTSMNAAVSALRFFFGVTLGRDDAAVGMTTVRWHADNEPGLGPEPVIVSLSLGAVRRFQLKHRTDRTRRVTLDLPHGSCLVMRGKTQQCWLHQLPKTRAPVGPARLSFWYIPHTRFEAANCTEKWFN